MNTVLGANDWGVGTFGCGLPSPTFGGGKPFVGKGGNGGVETLVFVSLLSQFGKGPGASGSGGTPVFAVEPGGVAPTCSGG